MSEYWNQIIARADFDDPIFDGDEPVYWPDGMLENAEKMTLLVRIENTRFVSCDACDEQHVEEVVIFPSPAQAKPRFFIMCPENGRVEVEPQRMMQWRLSFEGLTRFIARNLNLSGQIRELSLRRIWRLGVFSDHNHAVDVFLIRGANWKDAQNIASTVSSLASSPSPLVLVTRESLQDDIWPRKNTIVVSLTELVESDEADVSLNRDRLSEIIARKKSIHEQNEARRTVIIHPSLGRSVKKVRTKKRASRAVAIDAIKKELREHLRAARDHAYSTRDSDNGSTLLPRPTQAQLARQLDINVSSVSRAINDKSDKEIMILWEVAVDIDLVMQFKG